MSRILREALIKLEALPEADQDRIGRDLLDYVEKLDALRRDIQEGIDSFARGEGHELDIEDVLRRARQT